MTVLLNKVVGFALSPLTIGLAVALLGVVYGVRRRPRQAAFTSGVAVAWVWIWSTQALYRVLGGGLEQAYPPIRAEAMPTADAIVILGGGMRGSTNLVYSEMWSAADRVWHAARLYHAGKAPVVIPSGTDEVWHSVPLLIDLGVPREAIRVENAARNTEENAILTGRLVRELRVAGTTNRPVRVLLVTSAWHMRRSMLQFERSGVEAIAAATDHEALQRCDRELSVWHFFPGAENLYLNSVMWKEIVGYWLYRLKYLVLR